MFRHDHEQQRIDQAHAQAGETRVSMPVAVLLIAGFLALLVVPPLLHHTGLFLPADSAPDAEPFADFALNLPAALTSGGSGLAGLIERNRATLRELRRLEDELEREFRPARALRPHVQSWLVRWGQGNVEALIGRHGPRGRWLYFRPDVLHVTGPGFLEARVLQQRRRGAESWQTAPEPDPRPALLQLHRELAERGIDLLLLPTPVKPMLHPEGLTGGNPLTPTELQNPSWETFVRDLREAGVEMLLPWEAEAGELLIRNQQVTSLRTDSHWTPTTVEAVAASLARRLAPRLPAPASERYRHAAAQTHVGLGDIAGMLRLPEGQQRIAPESIETRPVVTLAGEPWQSRPDAPVLLLGDSFTNVFSQQELGWGTGAGLAEQLSLRLQTPVQRLAVNDGSDLAVRQRLAALPSERLESLEVVVYQFALRELTTGDWRLLDGRLLDGGSFDSPPGQTSTSGATTSEGEAVSVTIRSIPDLPSPAEIPYRDGIVGLLAEPIERDELGDLLVYTWWLCDGHPTAAASWAPGRKVELDLVPWASVATRLDSYQRVEADDPRAFLLDAYWSPIAGSCP